MIHIFAASGLEQCTPTPEDDEISQVQVVGLDQVHDLILQGVIQDGKTVIGLALFQAKFERGEIPSDFFF